MNRLARQTTWGDLYAQRSEDPYNPGIRIGISMVNPKTGAICDMPIALLEINNSDGTPTLKTHVWDITGDSDAFWDDPMHTDSIPVNQFITNQFLSE